MYYKVGQGLEQSERAFLYYKAGRVVLKLRASITKKSGYYYKVRQLLQNEVTIINKWGRYNNVGQLLPGKKVRWEKNGRKIDFEIRFPDLPLIFLTIKVCP